MEFVRENQYMRIYHDWRCEAVERELHSMDDNGVCCPNVKCYRIEAKEGYTFPRYIAVDDNAEPGDVVKFDFGDEVVGVGNAKAYKWEMADRLDLRAIAESGEIPKVGYRWNPRSPVRSVLGSAGHISIACWTRQMTRWIAATYLLTVRGVS